MYETIHEAAAALRAKKATPLDLVEQCFAQIDRWESHVHAWVFVEREYALAEARRLGEELERGHDRGPLHGIPLGIKDIVDIFDWPTAAGSARWAGSIARQDAPIIKRLRLAGAVFLGKTVTTQYASFDPPVTRNPWNLGRTPGGSSSGSAAALATGMCLGAIGSQTGGSINRPATYCGVAGCKPTFGTVPLEGIVPLAPSLDHPGPMARCVHDLELMLNVLQDHLVPDTALRSRHDEQGPPRLGWARGMFDDLAEPAARTAFADVVARLRRAGAVVDDFVLPAGFSDVVPRHRILMSVEGAMFHRERLERHPDDYGPKIRSLLEEGMRYSGPDYAAAKEHQEQLTSEMSERLLGTPDVLIMPATTGAAPNADTTGNPAFNSPWSYTGLPVVSFPTGQFAEGGVPLGMQIVAGHFQEDRLFRVAEWCERALGVKPLTPELPG